MSKNPNPLHSTSKSSFGGLSKSLDISSSDALKLDSAELQTKGSNIVLTSRNDINILASNINSGKDIGLTAFNNLNILSKAELLNKEEIHEKSSFNLSGLTALVGGNQSIYKQELHNNANTIQTNVSSNIEAKGNIIAQTGTTNIVGSNLEANNINIKADTGSINILNAQDSNNRVSLDKKIDVKLNDVVNSSISQFKNSFSGDTKLKIELAKATYDETAIKTNQTQSVSSNLNAREGNVVLDSFIDTNIVGSNVTAKEAIAINTQIGNINITNSQDTQSEDKKEKHANATINTTVQNEYVETAQAVIAVEKSAEQLKRIKKDYDNYKDELSGLESKLSDLKQRYKDKEVGIDYADIEDLNEYIDNVKSQEKYYKAAIVTATADLASKTVAVATQAAAAARSSGTLGFSGGVSLDVNGNKTNTNTNSSTAVASNLNAKDIYLSTNPNLNTSINIIGSNIKAENYMDIYTKDLNVKASQNTYNQNQDSKSINGSVSFTMYGGGGGTAGLGYGQSNSDINSTTNNNSTLLAKNMNITATNDANFIGATLRADESLDLNVGNNLNVESLRDEYSSNSKGFNVNAGIGFGSGGASGNRTPSLDVGGVASTNAGFSMNNGSSLEKQTVLSSITANNLKVNVGGNTNLKGSLIASGNFNENGSFTDNKNLDFTTKTLSFSNLSNSSFSSNQSIGASANYNFDSTKIVDGKEKTQQNGVSSASYSASNSLSTNVSKTLATLGQGNITIKDTANSDDLSRLNTNTENVNKDLYSSQTGTKVDATLDTRLLTEDGRNQIKDDYYTATAIPNAIEQILTSDKVGIGSFFEETQKNVKVYEGVKEKIASNKELANQLQDPNLSPSTKEQMLQQIALSVMQELGYVSNDVKLISTTQTGANGTQVKGYFVPITQTSFVNDKYNDSTYQLISSLGHEISHDMDKQDGIFVANNEGQNIYATNFGNNLAYYTNGALSITNGGSLAQTNSHNSGIVTSQPSVFNDYTLVKNNLTFASVDKSVGDDAVLYRQNGMYIGWDGQKNEDIYIVNNVTQVESNSNQTISLPKESVKLSILNTEFNQISGIIKKEGETNDPNEYINLAHASKNAANEKNKTLVTLLMSSFSSVPDKNPITPLNDSILDNYARAGVIDALTNSYDPTFGATLWDGSDFIAWGTGTTPYNTNGHAKFRQYNNIEINQEIYNNYLNAQPNSLKYFGQKYPIPQSVFIDQNNWINGNFSYDTKNNTSYGIEATTTAGKTIFWRKIK